MKPAGHESLASPIQKIVLVDEIVRADPVRFSSQSMQGHLLHIVLAGEVKQQAGGLYQNFRKGDVVWYHEGEPVKGHILRAPWKFITISFIAPALAPPNEGHRILTAGQHTLVLARRLLAFWRDPALPEGERALRCVATLSELLLDFMPSGTGLIPDVYPTNAHDRWWNTEKHLRNHLDQHLKLADIAALAGMCVRTTARACKAATGMTPVQRFRELRLAYAQNLLQHTILPVTEIAYRTGYPRVQEFSRDFKKNYDRTPSDVRNRVPDYLNLQPCPG